LRKKIKKNRDFFFWSSDAPEDQAIYLFGGLLANPDMTLRQERQWLWFPMDDLRDLSSWSSPPFLLLRDIHCTILTQYDCKVCESSHSQVNVGASDRLRSQDDVSQYQGTAPLSLPQFNRLFEVSFVRD
jgi:hypothetical protein